jgi:PAS domain S-box-containing protein
LNLEPAPRPWRERLARWDVAASALVRLAALGMAAMLLTYAGQLGLTLSPWSPMALPAGLAIAAASRWSYAAGAAAALGTCIALISTGVAPVHALLAAALVGLVPVPAQALLRLLGFDPRLERPADVLALALSVLMAGAFPAALLVAIWLDGHAAMAFLPALLIGWVVLGLGMLATAVAVLALDRGVLQAMQPGNAWLAPLASALAVAAMIWLLWVAPTLGGRLAPVALFFPLLVVTMLALRDQLALAAGGLLAAALLATGQSNSGIWLWAGAGGEGIALASWLAAALALMLASHAALVAWHERSQRWEWALDGSRLGVADWHLLRRDSFASAAWRSLTGHNARHWEVQAWRDQVHAEDRGLLDGAIAALTAGVDGRRQLELRMPHGDSWRWLETTLLVIERDHTGAPVRLLATLADAEQRHQAQERQLMSVSLFQHLHEGLLITDADLRALDVNPAYTHITGVPREELLGTVPSLLRPEPADPLARQQRAAMWAGLRDQGSWRGELLERRRSGEFCTLQATISTVRGPEQDLRYHVLVISDITQQQQQRDQLERQAHFDELTRLPNRTSLSLKLDEAMRAADRDGYLLVVCYLDLDRFKPVNDRYGHAAGDRLLVELATRLRSALRSRDKWEDCAARLGGDEFVLLAARRHAGRSPPGGRTRTAGGVAALRHRAGAGRGAGHGQHGRHRLPHRPQ